MLIAGISSTKAAKESAGAAAISEPGSQGAKTELKLQAYLWGSKLIRTRSIRRKQRLNIGKRHFLRDAQSEYEKQTAISWPIRLEKQFRLEN